MNILMTVLALTVAVPAAAQTVAAPAAAAQTVAAPIAEAAAAPLAATSVRKGQVVKDSNAALLGTVDKLVLAADGSLAAIKMIFGVRFVAIPASSLTLKDGVLVTSLTRSQISKLG